MIEADRRIGLAFKKAGGTVRGLRILFNHKLEMLLIRLRRGRLHDLIKEIHCRRRSKSADQTQFEGLRQRLRFRSGCRFREDPDRIENRNAFFGEFRSGERHSLIHRKHRIHGSQPSGSRGKQLNRFIGYTGCLDFRDRLPGQLLSFFVSRNRFCAAGKDSRVGGSRALCVGTLQNAHLFHARNLQFLSDRGKPVKHRRSDFNLQFIQEFLDRNAGQKNQINPLFLEPAAPSP